MPPIQEQVFLASPITFGRERIIASPFQFAFTGEDRLKVLVMSSLTLTVPLTMRFLRDDGEIDVTQHGWSVPGDRLAHIFDVSMGHGFLTNLLLRPFGPVPQIGECYIVVYVVRGSGQGPVVFIGQVVGGYASLNMPLAWPGSPIVAPTEGAGAVRTYTLPALSPGLEIGFTVPINTRWAVTNLHTVFQTGATAGTRHVALTYRTPPTTFGTYPQVAGVGPSDAVEYTWGRGLASRDRIGGFAAATAPIPIEVLLGPGTVVQTIVSLADPVLDFWHATDLHVQEWLTLQ